jgi:sugar phosphate isomerase/epimerase
MSWRIGLSTGACTECSILDILPALAASGAPGVEVSTPPRHFDPLQEDQIVALGRELQAANLEAVSIHAPFGGLLDLADPNPHHRHAAIGAILTTAAAIRRLGGRLIVVHPSDLERHGRDVNGRLADAARSLAVLAENCRRENVTLVIESPLPHLIGGHPDEFAWLLGQVDDSVRVCLDTGHAALGRHWHRFIEVAGSRLTHIHANDNHGRRDDHLPPGDGVIDWFEIRRTLVEAGFSGWLMLELSCPPGDPAAYFKRAVQRTTELFAETASRR